MNPSRISKMVGASLILIGVLGLLETAGFLYLRSYNFAIYTTVIAVLFFAIGFGLWKENPKARLAGIILFAVCFVLAAFNLFIQKNYSSLPVRIGTMLFEVICFAALLYDYRKSRPKP